ncbi:MAG: hypothetical protein WC458_03625 [Patescibacteria group bacterium]|jgi:hypothetical protein
MIYSNLYVRFYAFRQRVGLALAAVWRLSSCRPYFLAAGLLQILNWLQAFFIYRHLTGEFLVLHYNVDFGVDLVGSPAQIFIYPLFSLGVFVFNLSVAAAFNRHRNFKLFAHLLLSTAIIFGLFFSLALLFIYLINFR